MPSTIAATRLALGLALASAAAPARAEPSRSGLVVYSASCDFGVSYLSAVDASGVRIPATHDGLCPQSMVFDPAGNLYIGEDADFWATSGKIQKRDPSGNLGVFAAGAIDDPLTLLGAQGISKSLALAVDRHGRVFAGAPGPAYQDVRVIYPDLSVTPFVARVAGLSGIQEIDTSQLRAQGLKSVSGLAIDDWGDLFISDEVSGTIFRIEANGAQEVFAGLPGAAGLAFDAQGRLFAGTDSGDVVRIGSDGSVHVFSPGAGATYPIAPYWLASDGTALYTNQLGSGIDASGNPVYWSQIIKIDRSGARSPLGDATSAVTQPTGIAACKSDSCASATGVLVADAYDMLLSSQPQYAFHFGYDPNNWVFGSIVAGDANKGSVPDDQADIGALQEFSPNPGNAYLQEKWDANFEGVARCNRAISAIGEADPGEDASPQSQIAELRFLRAFYYFELEKAFGPRLPWLDENSLGTAPSMSAAERIWGRIEADLRFAADHLPRVSSQPRIPNQWAAKALLAKVLLFQGRFANAKALFDEVIARGVTTSGEKYALHPRFERNFDVVYNNGPESVFAEQARFDGAANHAANYGYALAYPYAPFSCCGFFQPSQGLVNSYQVDDRGLPLFDPGHASFPFNRQDVKNDDGLPSAEPFTPSTVPLDPRLDWTVGRRGIPYLDWGIYPGQDWVRDPVHGGPYSPIKNVFRIADLNATPPRAGGFGTLFGGVDGWADAGGMNFNLIRFADVLLMAAECEVEAGSLGQALDYVNQVRRRANASRVKTAGGSDAANYRVSQYPSFPTRQYAREAVRFERKLELAMEGHRFFDLIRWGGDYAGRELNDGYLSHEKELRPEFVGVVFDPACNSYFPTPQTAPDPSGRLCGYRP